MTRHHIAALASLALAACSSGGAGDAGDSGLNGVPDICNAPSTASPAAQCELNIVAAPADGGVAGQQFYIDHVGKQLWLWLKVPSPIPAQSLLNIVAGYTAETTPVDLSLNVYQQNAATSVTTIPLVAVQSATGKPGIITFTYVFDPTVTPAGSDMWIDLGDESNSHDDVHNAISIYADITTDPDPNSSTMPTPVTLGAASGGIQTGTCANTSSGDCEGVLSTYGRVDSFSVAIPAGGAPQILYTNVEANTSFLTPAPAYDLAYQILNGAGDVLNSGNVANVETAAYPGDAGLASALLVSPGDTYTVQVFGLNPTLVPPAAPAPPDTRVTYQLNVELMPNLDTNGHTIGEAFADPVAFSGAPTSGGAVSLPQTGRLSYLGQEDWFYVSFPDTAGQPTRLHYKFTAGTTGNRYPAFGPNPPDRLSNLMIDIPPLPDGGSSTGICLDDPAVCPQDPEYAGQYIPDSGTMFYQAQLVQQLCEDGDGDGGALCLLSGREEFNADEMGFAPLQNFEGIVPLQGTGAQGMVLEYLSAGSRYCDDMPYTLALDWEAMPNPISSLQNPLSFGTLGGSTTTQSGAISVGFGYLVQYLQMLMLPDVRGADDYDATPSTADVWEADIPGSLQGAALGATWGLGWSVTDSSGMPAENLILSVTFCDSSGTCGSPGTIGPSLDNVTGAIYYNSGADLPWWDPGGNPWGPISIADFGMGGATVFDTANVSGGQSYTLSPFSCTCIQPNFLPAGKFYVTVLGADRTAWTDTDYTLSMSISSYPQSTGVMGVECPVATLPPDGGTDGGPIVGCQFIDCSDQDQACKF